MCIYRVAIDTRIVFYDARNEDYEQCNQTEDQKMANLCTVVLEPGDSSITIKVNASNLVGTTTSDELVVHLNDSRGDGMTCMQRRLTLLLF
jgi:hypothetical protein